MDKWDWITLGISAALLIGAIVLSRAQQPEPQAPGYLSYNDPYTSPSLPTSYNSIPDLTIATLFNGQNTQSNIVPRGSISYN